MIEANQTEFDVTIENHGTIFLFRPNTLAAREWIDQHVTGDQQWFGGALAVERGYAEDLAIGLAKDGMSVE